jgi:glucosamine--fructose-6-phosphate aminotransferase (isomerizing)
MRLEIDEQPAALRRTLAALVPRIRDVRALSNRAGRGIMFLARGSSDNAAAYGSYLIQTRAGLLSSSGSPSISTTYGAYVDLEGMLVVALSQSGQTDELVESLRWAHRCGAHTLAITNRDSSPLAEAAELTLVTQAGSELAVPATKTFTSQLVAMAIIAAGVGAELDLTELARVPDEIERLLAIRPDFEPMATSLAQARAVIVTGRGLTAPVALEVALKVQETCYLPAIGLSSADLQHGPIAMLGEQVPLLVLAPNSGPTVAGLAQVARLAGTTGAQVYGVGGNSELVSASTASIVGARLPEWVAPIGLTIQGQLLVENLAQRLGLSPDRPRGLNKITQTA